MEVPKADVVLPVKARDREADARRQRRAALRQSQQALPPPLLKRITIHDRNGLQTTGLLLSCGVLSLGMFFDSLSRAKRQGDDLDRATNVGAAVGVVFLNASTVFMLTQIMVPLAQAANPMHAAKLNRSVERALAPIWPSSMLGTLRVTAQAHAVRTEREAQEAANAAPATTTSTARTRQARSIPEQRNALMSRHCKS